MTTANTKALKPVEVIRQDLTRMSDQFKMALPSHIPVERFTRVAQTAIANNPKLVEANRASLFGACVKAAQAGLLPDGKESALVPFGSDVQFMPMITGILKLIRNSGELSTIVAEIVHEKDEFNYYIDSDGQHLTHKPNLLAERGKAIGVYCLAKLKDGAIYFEFMTEKQVGDVRSVSRSKDGPAWTGAFKHEMWKKSVTRRLAKRLPLSTDLDMALKSDDDNYDFDQTDEAPAADEPKAPKQSRVKSLMKEAEPVVEAAEPEPQAKEPEAPRTAEQIMDAEVDEIPI